MNFASLIVEIWYNLCSTCILMLNVTYSHVTLLNSQNKYKYVQINIKIHPSFNIKAIPPAKLQSVIPQLNTGISGLKTVSKLNISVGTILKFIPSIFLAQQSFLAIVLPSLPLQIRGMQHMFSLPRKQKQLLTAPFT